ncbi:hypothetical protein [Dethiosulfovibrio salsuginis]|uniref:Uncharacterized protein n=1 Tax=Dethiosulfovibrio salsuginis TaxID=561720 RepID=A0A1X7J707_9BACT|nr:hypothetical protein [Dethiosulfovibrio salsuginis]SMG23290.1 hypothetical protein SAMN06275492_10913 [Dethiosulfovibrio salsuginis]
MLSPAVDSLCVHIWSHWESIIDSMALLAEYRDKTTGGHIQRTKGYFRLIMEKSGGFDLYPSEDLSLVCHSADVYDALAQSYTRPACSVRIASEGTSCAPSAWGDVLSPHSYYTTAGRVYGLWATSERSLRGLEFLDIT